MTESEQILRVWDANPTFTLGEVTKASVQTSLGELRTLHGQTEDMRTSLKRFVNETNAKANELNAILVRARMGIRATYGPDSSQYEQVGGTRSSERKKPKASKGKTS